MRKAKVNFNVTLPVTIIREDKSFIAYTPALDLSTVGDSFEEAKSRFGEAVQIFFEEIIENGTVDKALTELGWKKKENCYMPPVVISQEAEQFSVPCFN